MTAHFAVDLGAESGRCIAGFLDNGILRLEELHRFPTRVCELRGDYYWNIYRFYDEILHGLKIYAEKYGEKLDSIGVDTWGCDYALLDKTGELRNLPKSYRRMTSQEPYRVIETRMGREALYAHCGIQFLDFNTLNQLIFETEKDNEYLRNVCGMMFIGDALHYLLDAPAVCEYSVASISQMCDTNNRCWDDQVFEAFDLPKSLQTRIVFAGDEIGILRDEIADAVGLQRGIRIIAPAVHDTASASVAIPANGTDWASISSGTWSIASVELNAPINNAQSYEMNISNSAGVLGKSLFLKNIMGLWIIQQCKYRWEEMCPGLTYPKLVDLAEKAQPFAGWIDPDDKRFFTPGDMPERVRDFLRSTGQSVPDAEDIGQLARIVYESLAMKYRQIFARIADASGRSIHTLHITGGGSNNEMLNRFTANAMQVPVVAGPTECSAMGNLLMQAYGCGALADLEEIRTIVRASSTLKTFLPDASNQWETAYKQYLQYAN